MKLSNSIVTPKELLFDKNKNFSWYYRFMYHNN
jgi:hypothetical protein